MQSRVLFFALAMLPAACSEYESISRAIGEAYELNPGSVSLAHAWPKPWQRVCFFGPYTTDATAREVLGFSYPLERRHSIKYNEGITVILFATESEVVAVVQHPRRQGDFANLSRQCFSRGDAVFRYESKPVKGWPGMFPANGA